MSPKIHKTSATKRKAYAPVFAALGDETRLAIVVKLCSGQPHSISQLTQDFTLTRQAITKHLRILESVGIVHGVRAGRESLYKFDPVPMQGMKDYLEGISTQWDQSLARLKAFIED
jgi:DNA-binding transcriptional ArsR family regulator